MKKKRQYKLLLCKPDFGKNDPLGSYRPKPQLDKLYNEILEFCNANAPTVIIRRQNNYNWITHDQTHILADYTITAYNLEDLLLIKLAFIDKFEFQFYYYDRVLRQTNAL